jgi:hypothetical protein
MEIKRGVNDELRWFPARNPDQGGRRPRADEGVPPVSDREREGGYRFGFELGGLRVLFCAGPNGVPRPVFIFILFSSFLFSVILNSFITFSNLIQIDSKQLCKVSKIQNNIPEQ